MTFDGAAREWSITREPEQGVRMLCDLFVEFGGYALGPSSNIS